MPIHTAPFEYVFTHRHTPFSEDPEWPASLACQVRLILSPQLLCGKERGELSICLCPSQSHHQPWTASPLCLRPAAPVRGFEGWDWRAQEFPYSEKTICSCPIIICHNSYLTAFVWFTPGVVVHVIRTRHHRLVLHCKCNHFFEGKHLSLHLSNPHTPIPFPMPHCHYYSYLSVTFLLLLSVPSESHQFYKIEYTLILWAVHSGKWPNQVDL